MDVEALAGKLTPARKRIVMAMTPGEFHDAYQLCRQRGTRMALTNSGLTEPRQCGPITEYWTIRLTERGIAVREYLLREGK